MYNNLLADSLRQMFGDEKFKIYCEMEVEKNRIEQELLSSPLDANYEEFFWKTKLEELKQKENH
jgi:hypothetical protein